MRRLPPLNWLRSFESAARHLSITRAAEELNVTQAAVSQQVRSLEDNLALKLFRRAGRRLFLTESGQALAPKLRDAFDLMAEGVRDCHARSAEGTLTLRVSSSFAPQWLMPRLGRFYSRHPDIDVRLTTVDREVDFAREDLDAEIRFFNDGGNASYAAYMFRKPVSPPVSGTSTEYRALAFAGISSYDISVCHADSAFPRLPMGRPSSSTSATGRGSAWRPRPRASGAPSGRSSGSSCTRCSPGCGRPACRGRSC